VVTRAIDPEARDALVPFLILQPLVENAIKHGVAPHLAPGRVSIEAEVHDARLLLRVSDSGRGPTAGTLQRLTQGVGLSNTRARLQHLYGDDHRFTFEHGPSGGVRVEVDVPLRRAAADSTAYHEATEIPA
jgi:LytS/YehU family sensor histidine kinase